LILNGSPDHLSRRRHRRRCTSTDQRWTQRIKPPRDPTRLTDSGRVIFLVASIALIGVVLIGAHRRRRRHEKTWRVSDTIVVAVMSVMAGLRICGWIGLPHLRSAAGRRLYGGGL
ncbi:hypothetical protein, partial [Kineococcus arenarius]|uniref:hypothetical protein n=1 Tax=unclassified Kineococcus TaxID=2621656 RepID=UPI003D7EE22D